MFNKNDKVMVNLPPNNRIIFEGIIFAKSDLNYNTFFVQSSDAPYKVFYTDYDKIEPFQVSYSRCL